MKHLLNKKNGQNQSIYTAILASASLGLALSAGTATAYNGPEEQGSTASSPVRVMDNLFHFARADTLIGSEVQNYRKENIGSISDFVIDRGSGRITVAIINSGDFLGLGGSEYAVSYDELRYMPVTKSFQSQLTKDELERRTEFVPENREDLGDNSWLNETVDNFDGDEEVDHAEDSMREAVRKGERETLKGDVTRVLRQSYKGHEQVFVIVQDENNEQQTVLMGPSWYIMGSQERVKAGDRVEFSVVEYDTYVIAAEGEVNRKRMTLRDQEGKGQWETKNPQNPERYMLLSDLEDMNAEIAGSTVGEVQTTLVEGGSGMAAMIALDPNDNLFGLGDELSLIPWSAISFSGNSHVIIDGNETEIDRTLKMPEDPGNLRTRSTIKPAYDAFERDVPDFEPRDMQRKNQYDDSTTDRSDKLHGDAWGADSELVKALRNGDDVELSGKFQRMASVSVVSGAPEASVIIIDTKQGRQRVIVGPASFTENHDFDLSEGDTITIMAKRATIDGREWMAARSVKSGEKNWTLWNKDQPVWSD